MLTRELLKKIRRIEIVTARQAQNLLAGAYHSVFKGLGMAFSEVRQYQPGDDVRTIDWNVTARTGQPFIKRFVEERELTLLLVVDVSGSQRFGTGATTKRAAAAELAAQDRLHRPPRPQVEPSDLAEHVGREHRALGVGPRGGVGVW